MLDIRLSGKQDMLKPGVASLCEPGLLEHFPPSQAKAYTRLASLQPDNLDQASLDEPNHVNSIISHT
jgi:hypothetical protein